MFPYLRGNVAGAVNYQVDNVTTYNYCNTVLIHWVTAAFSGWRGSIRWKIAPRGRLNIYEKPVYQIQRGESGTHSYDDDSIDTAASFDSNSHMNYNTVQSYSGGSYAANKPLVGPRGLVFQSGYVNPNCEYEVPFYSDLRFIPGKHENYTESSGAIAPTVDHRIWVAGDFATVFDHWCATGEDFQVYFFTGMPRVFYEDVPPLPSLSQ
jgi:hypothetical protein